MLQKVMKIGNSAGTIIPKNLLTSLKVRIGGMIDMKFDEAANRITIDVPRKAKETKIKVDPEVYAVANDLLKRYLPAFKKLAKPHD